MTKSSTGSGGREEYKLLWMSSCHHPMLIKQQDDVQPTLDVLEGLAARENISDRQKEWIEEELYHVRTGSRGEKEAAYHIDFALRNGKNWAVIHDLRLEHKGRVAQIDHLLVSRMFDLIVIESKNVQTALRANPNGEFEVRRQWGWQGMSSPVEQNKRHIQVLSELIGDHKLTPTRLGFRIQPKFHNWVLVSPKCLLPGERTAGATILKMDLFDRGLDEHNNKFSDVLILAKVCAPETILDFAQKLVGFHRLASFDYAAKFGLSTVQRYAPMNTGVCAASPAAEGSHSPMVAEAGVCDSCDACVEPKVSAFCRAHEKRFGGRILCRKCQSATPRLAQATSRPHSADTETCEQCHIAVEGKVVLYCRSHSRRFGGQILCRSCQAAEMSPAD